MYTRTVCMFTIVRYMYTSSIENLSKINDKPQIIKATHNYLIGDGGMDSMAEYVRQTCYSMQD